MKKTMKLSSTIFLFVMILFSACAKNDVTTITLNKTTTYLIVGQTDTLTAVLTAIGDIKSIPQTWTSSNLTVATVNNGVVTAIAVGSATITVKAGAKTSICDVTVDDKILPNLTQAELDYYGNAYGTDSTSATGSNNFILYMASSGINMTDFKGNGEVLVVELNTPLSVKDSIPVGTYDMITKVNFSITDLTPFTLVPAYVDTNLYHWGCWYYGLLVDPVSTGNIVATKINGNYVINYEFFDDFGVKISGVFQGPVSFVDATKLSAVKNKMKLRSVSKINHPVKIMSFKRR